MIHQEAGVAKSQGVRFLKVAKSTAVESARTHLREPRGSDLQMHPGCLEFEPQNLGIVAINPDGQIVDANDVFLSMTGYSKAELPLDMTAITPSEWHELDDQKIRQFAENGDCLPWQKQILDRQGHRLSILIGVAAVNPNENQVQYFIANTEDRRRTDAVILDYQSQLRHAAVELSLLAERERRSIAGDLHDNIGQELAIAKLKLSKLRAETTGDIGATLDEIAAQISNSLGSCRRLSHALATPSLYKLGLVPAIKNLVATLNLDQQLSISLRFDDEEIALPINTRIILYRVIRELLVNVLKHAQASSVEILGTQVDEMFKLVLVDDGIGCDASKALTGTNAEHGLGLFLVRERMRHIGGSFELESLAGKGTRVTLLAPMERTMNELDSSS